MQQVPSISCTCSPSPFPSLSFSPLSESCLIFPLFLSVSQCSKVLGGDLQVKREEENRSFFPAARTSYLCCRCCAALKCQNGAKLIRSVGFIHLLLLPDKLFWTIRKKKCNLQTCYYILEKNRFRMTKN